MYKTLNFYTPYDEIINESHVVIGGASGAGKSVLLDDLIYNLTAFNPEYQKIVLIDPKRVSFLKWSAFPHVLELVTEPHEITQALERLNQEMDYRYNLMQKQGLEESDKYLIHVIIDEANEVLRDKRNLELVDRLFRLARAASIHCILASQDVSRSTGIPARIWKNSSCNIGLRCNNATDSRQVIFDKGCESLPKYGYCIVRSCEGLYKVKVPYTDREKIKNRLAEVNEYYR